MKIRSLAVLLCIAGLGWAQNTAAPAQGTAPAPRRGPGGRGPGFGPGPGGLLNGNAEQRLTSMLALDATQQNTLHQTLASARVQTQGLGEKSAALRNQLATAVKSGDEAQIESVTQQMSALQQQQASIHAKSLATIYNSLSASQKPRFEQLMNRELGVPGPRPAAGRGGPRPRPRAGAQPAVPQQ